VTDSTKPGGALPTRDGQKTRDWVLEKFSIKQLVRRTEDVYMEVLSKKRSRHHLNQDAMKEL
jgi:hypothetical protein